MNDNNGEKNWEQKCTKREGNRHPTFSKFRQKSIPAKELFDHVVGHIHTQHTHTHEHHKTHSKSRHKFLMRMEVEIFLFHPSRVPCIAFKWRRKLIRPFRVRHNTHKMRCDDSFKLTKTTTTMPLGTVCSCAAHFTSHLLPRNRHNKYC